MNREEVVKIAREVADKDKVDPVNSQGDMITLFPEELMRLIDRVQAKEREECAKLCDEESKKVYQWKDGLAFSHAAKLIRVRGQ